MTQIRHTYKTLNDAILDLVRPDGSIDTNAVLDWLAEHPSEILHVRALGHKFTTALAALEAAAAKAGPLLQMR